MAVDKQQLDRALDQGERREMPENVPPGMLGETPLDQPRPEGDSRDKGSGLLRTVDSDAHGDNAGFLQDTNLEIRFLLIAGSALLVVTSPVALWLIWRDRKWKAWFKVALTAGVAVYLGWVAWRVTR